MRIVALTAIVLLSAGCAAESDHRSHGTPSSTTAAADESSAVPTTRSAPTQGASVADLESWTRAGHKVEASEYSTARLDSGAVTDLKSDRAFTSPSGKISCITDYEHGDQGIVCLVELKNPPAKPHDGMGNWKGGWIRYTGSKLTVGAFRGDPGPFVQGRGPELPYGSALSMRGFTCRMDSSGLTCVNPAVGSGVQMSDAGVIPFGCLKEQAATQNDNAGVLFSC
ncbi:hypothetical protein ACFQZZ_19265 [Nocardia sp. GCM10030253]|uniref:hypothetical protein n=1 Tax=Nocardia sp. GCM10030253 TaxID=3273404 RepID=UPI0036279D7D